MSRQETKRCSRCSTRKPLTEFYRNSRRSGGYSSHCKLCHNELTRAYYARNREAARAGQKRYREKHRGTLAVRKAAHLRRRKQQAVARYSRGSACACCGEQALEFLTVVARDSLARVSVHALWEQGYPPGYRVLCYNCQMARYRHGKCPHQKRRGRS